MKFRVVLCVLFVPRVAVSLAKRQPQWNNSHPQHDVRPEWSSHPLWNSHPERNGPAERVSAAPINKSDNNSNFEKNYPPGWINNPQWKNHTVTNIQPVENSHSQRKSHPKRNTNSEWKSQYVENVRPVWNSHTEGDDRNSHPLENGDANRNSRRVENGGAFVNELSGHSHFARNHSKHGSTHKHRNRSSKGVNAGLKNGAKDGEKDKIVLDIRQGEQYNPYSKHHAGRHVCTRNLDKPIKTKQAYCKPTFKNYVVNCEGNQICKGVRLVYETHYKDVVMTRSSNEVVHLCCPGWSQTTNRSHGCHKATCSKPCLNGGKCIKPEMCACLKGYSGQQCENPVIIPECQEPCLNGGKCVKENVCSCPKGFGGSQCEMDLNKPQCSKGCQNGGTCSRHEVCKCPKGFEGRHCEQDIDECKEQKPCDQICYNTHGSYSCQCREDFVLQSDGQSCRKEIDDGDGGLEAKDLEFEMLDKRLLKLETMMDESHKNDVSKNDLENVFKDMGSISEDVSSLKNKMNDVENYKRDMYIFKNKLNKIEKKAEQVDELVLKYDRIKKCAFYNKICM
ncbi:hypothetical protein JTB14_028782 [Gonioctena quinquepunctata]|nr:hypothetical protein JTB14_028782 [Gonioctena quinquepunctata]